MYVILFSIVIIITRVSSLVVLTQFWNRILGDQKLESIPKHSVFLEERIRTLECSSIFKALANNMITMNLKQYSIHNMPFIVEVNM